MALHVLLAVLLLPSATAVVPGAYCGALSLPTGLGTNNVTLVVHPNRHSLSMELHGPHLDMHCLEQEFATAGYDVNLASGCVSNWLRDHNLKAALRHDPRAMTIEAKLVLKWGWFSYTRVLVLSQCDRVTAA